MNDFSKIEILDAAIKATKDKTITLKDIEFQLKKLGFKTNVETFSVSTKRAVVSQLKLASAKKQSDKLLISTLEKELASVQKQLADKDKLISLLENINSKSDKMLEIQEEIVELKTRQVEQPTLLDVPENTNVSSKDQTQLYSSGEEMDPSNWPQDDDQSFDYDDDENDDQ